MEKSFRSELTGCFGDPVDENPTGVMVEAAYRALDINWRYQLLHVGKEHLKTALEGIRVLGFQGINLTIPHKIAAVPMMDRLSPSAQIIGAINTVKVLEDGSLLGENTDGKGFVEGMRQNGVGLWGKRIVLLGAGGAARAVGVECALAGCGSVGIIARKEKPGMELKYLIAEAADCETYYERWVPGVSIPECDILINCTNIGLYPDKNKPDICYGDIRSGMVVQDIIPNPAVTPFLLEAKKQGALVYDGMQMLVQQAVIAVQLWTGRQPAADVMLQALQGTV